MCSIDADKFSLPITGIFHVENVSHIFFKLQKQNKNDWSGWFSSGALVLAKTVELENLQLLI